MPGDCEQEDGTRQPPDLSVSLFSSLPEAFQLTLISWDKFLSFFFYTCLSAWTDFCLFMTVLIGNPLGLELAVNLLASSRVPESQMGPTTPDSVIT